MRWLWIDRFTEFVSGSHTRATKCVTIAEQQIDDYFQGYPILTPTFVLEGFAQSGGLLIGQMSDFHERVVLAKVSKSKFHFLARPGDTLRYHVDLQTIQSDGGLVEAKSYVGDRLHGEAELTFAHVSNAVTETDFFEPHVFLRMLRIFRLFDVGVDQEGNPLKIPNHLAEAEANVLGHV